MDRTLSSRWFAARLPVRLIGSALLSTLLATLIAACGQPLPPQEDVVRTLRAMTVGDVAQFSGRSFPGRAAASQEVNLSFRVSGPLITFPVKVGHKVAAGDVVARVDPRDFEVRVLNMQGELDRANAERVLAEREHRRALDAVAKNRQLISASEVDRRLGARDRARANVNALQASLQAAKDQLAYSELTTPFSGRVVNTYVENFETIRAEQPILRVLDTARIELTINIPETLIASLPYVENIRVRYDAFPDVEIPAEISEVGSEASQSTRTYPVTLIMDQPAGAEILPGMAGRAMGVVQSDRSDRVLVIPVTAVFSPEAGAKSFVWVIDAATSTVSRREIDAQRLVTGGVEVTSGLTRGDVIAVAGVHFLAEGQRVKPVFD